MKKRPLSQRRLPLQLTMGTEFWMMLGHIPGAELVNIVTLHQLPNCNSMGYRETPVRSLPDRWLQ
jgi:hypothetical protein